MKCKYCSTRMRKKDRFCSFCGKITRCLSCNQKLQRNAVACYVCGSKVSGAQNNIAENLNRVEFHEDLESRSLVTDFTDKTASELGSIIGGVISSKLKKRSKIDPIELNTVERQEVSLEAPELPAQKQNPDIVDINFVNSEIEKLFVNKNDEWHLGESRLKAKNLKDHGRRILLLFLLLGDRKSFPIDSKLLNSLLKRCAVYDGGVRSYMSSNNDYHIIDGNYELTFPGKEEAERILEEVFDSSLENTWVPGKNRSKKNSGGSKYKVVDIPINGDGKLELKKRYDSLKKKTYVSTIMVIINFFMEKKSLEGMNVNEIHSAYRKIGETSPSDIRGTIAQGEKKGFLEGVKRGVFKITSIGKEELKKLSSND